MLYFFSRPEGTFLNFFEIYYSMLVKRVMLLVAVSFILSSSLASAIPDPVQFLFDGVTQAIDIVINVAAPIFDVVLGEYNGSTGDFSYTEFFFIRCMLLVLLFLILNATVKAVPTLKDHKGVGFIIALCISVIAVRFMSTSELIYGVLLPYGTLGVAVLTLLPSIAFFYFIHVTKIGSAGRRLAWIFWGIALLVLWLYNFDNLSEAGNWIYGLTFIALIILLIFDKDIHRYFRLWDLKKFHRGADNQRIANLQANYMRWLNLDTPEANAAKRDIERQLTELNARIPY